MARFLPLTVSDVRQDTRDAVVVTLTPRASDKQAFKFIQGQYLTFRKIFEGGELRRSYSICSATDDEALRVGIKKVVGGVFSTWANEVLQPGAILEAMPPMGKFYTQLDPRRIGNYLAFAVGSGITPVLSVVKTTLAQESLSTFTLVYANRSINSIMFREELEDLKNRYMGRFSVIHILKSDTQEIDLFTGRIDEEKCAQLFKSWIDIASVNTAFICGPEPLMDTIARSLRNHGLGDNQIKYELFASSQTHQATDKTDTRPRTETTTRCQLSITLDGATRSLDMAKSGQSVLEAALDASLDVPYACKAGVCSTCRALVIKGEVEMLNNQALEDYEVKRGYVLTCQCYPLSDQVVLTYDR